MSIQSLFFSYYSKGSQYSQVTNTKSVLENVEDTSSRKSIRGTNNTQKKRRKKGKTLHIRTLTKKNIYSKRNKNYKTLNQIHESLICTDRTRSWCWIAQG